MLPTDLAAERRAASRAPGDGRAPPAVLVTPRLGVLAGGEGGTLALAVGGGTGAASRRGASSTASRHEGDAVIGDIRALRTAVDTQVPGAGRHERGLARRARRGDRRAVRPSHGRRSVASRRSRARRCSRRRTTTRSATARWSRSTRLRSSPSSSPRSASRSPCVTDLRDDRGDLYDLEAQGAEPSLLRRIVRVRALVVGRRGRRSPARSPGALLALLVTRVVAVTARAATRSTCRCGRRSTSASCCGRRRRLPPRRRRARRAGDAPPFRGDRGPARAQELRRMSLVEARDLFCVYPGADGRRRRAAGADARRRGGRGVRRPRAERLGQDDADARASRASSGRAPAASPSPAARPRRALRRAPRATTAPSILGYADQHYWRALAGELTAEQLVAVPLGLQGAPRARPARPRARAARARRAARPRRRHPPSCRGASNSASRSARARAPPAAPHRRRAHRRARRGRAPPSSTGCSRSSRGRRASTTLVVSHDPRSAAIADRVVHIRDGRVSEERRSDGTAVVIGSGGWLRLPEDALLDGRHRRPRHGHRPGGRCRAAPARHHARGEPADAPRMSRARRSVSSSCAACRAASAATSRSSA